MSKAVGLSTIDNPFSPFDDFYNWYRFDCEHDYNSCSLLDRITKTSSELSDAEYDEIINEAIDEILEHDYSGLRIKVSPGFVPNPIEINYETGEIINRKAHETT